MPEDALPRVSPPRIFPAATRASRPPAGSGGSPDTHRQTGFVLGDNLDHIVTSLNLEGAAAEASSGAKYRKQVVAVSLASWSRSWLLRLQALHAVEWGNYAAAFPLIAVAADAETGSAALIEEAASSWESWLANGGIAPAPEHHATHIRAGASPAPGSLPALDPVARTAGLLASTDFAAAVLLAANDSTPERTLVTFGDRDFHLGLAELALGFLITLGVERARLLLAHAGTVAVADPAALEASIASGERLLARTDRCRVALGAAGFVVDDWRRQPGGQPRRLLL